MWASSPTGGYKGRGGRPFRRFAPPPLAQGRLWGTDCHGQCAHWPRNDMGFCMGCGGRPGGGVRAPRPTKQRRDLWGADGVDWGIFPRDDLRETNCPLPRTESLHQPAAGPPPFRQGRQRVTRGAVGRADVGIVPYGGVTRSAERRPRSHGFAVTAPLTQGSLWGRIATASVRTGLAMTWGFAWDAGEYFERGVFL